MALCKQRTVVLPSLGRGCHLVTHEARGPPIFPFSLPSLTDYPPY